MKSHRIKNLIVSQIWLMKIINFCFNLKNRKAFAKEIQRRKQEISIFDYKSLSQPLPYAPDEIVIDNNLYGIAYCLKKYAGVSTYRYLDAYIEHGIFFGNLVREDQSKIPVSSILTYSSIREKHLLKSNIQKNIQKIGPFIYYSNSLLSEEQKRELKKKLGKTLLVFPSHGIIGVDSKFDEDAFIKKISELYKYFDTVLISLYWVDALKEDLVSKYEKKGYKIVTSGHRFDLNFLSRQRSLIELSDYTMSNSVGTHVGYCVTLNRPHYIFRQKIENKGKNILLQKHFDKVRNKEELLTERIEKEEVYEVFSSFYIDGKITKKQRDIVAKYWGSNYIKTREELKQILELNK